MSAVASNAQRGWPDLPVFGPSGDARDLQRVDLVGLRASAPRSARCCGHLQRASSTTPHAGFDERSEPPGGA